MRSQFAFRARTLATALSPISAFAPVMIAGKRW